MKYEIKNTSPAPQGVHATDGLVHLKPGETRLLDLDADSHARVMSLPFLVIGGTLKPRQLAPGEMLEEGDLPVGVTLGTVDEILTGDDKGQTLPPIAGEGIYEDMTDEELASAYEATLGKKPHHKAKRETLIAHLRGV